MKVTNSVNIHDAVKGCLNWVVAYGVEVLATNSRVMKRYSCSYPMVSSVLDDSLLLTRRIFPADLLRVFICWTAAVFLLACAIWLLSHAVSRNMTKIRRLIGCASISRATT